MFSHTIDSQSHHTQQLSFDDRINHSSVPQMFCWRTQNHLRQRQTEVPLRGTTEERSEVSSYSATATASDVQKDQLTPEQTEEL